MNNKLISMQLAVISAEAELLAARYREGKLWEGDLEKGVARLSEEVRELAKEVQKEGR